MWDVKRDTRWGDYERNGFGYIRSAVPECGNYKSPAHLPHRIQEIQRCVPYRRKCGLLRQPQHSRSVLVRGLCRRVDKQASAPLTSLYLFLDYVYLDKTDTIQVVNRLKGSPIPISIVSGLVTLTASISGQPVTVSGSVVWGAGTSGEIQVQTMSGDYVSVSGAVSISGNVVITSVSGNVVSALLSGGSISGQMVWGTGTSGQVQVQTTSGSFITVSGTVITSVSGNVVQVSGQAVFVYVSGGSFSADVSGNVVWGYGTSGQMPVFTVSGSWVTISGTFQVSLSGSTITASVSGQPISVVAYPPLTVWQSGTGTLSTYITTSASQFLDHVEYSATSGYDTFVGYIY